jgi:hypothetical protein
MHQSSENPEWGKEHPTVPDLHPNLIVDVVVFMTGRPFEDAGMVS